MFVEFYNEDYLSSNESDRIYPCDFFFINGDISWYDRKYFVFRDLFINLFIFIFKNLHIQIECL